MKFVLHLWSAVIVILALAACDAVRPEMPTTFAYTKPSSSGLSPIKPFPKPNAVCLLLGESENTSMLRKKGKELIACPKHEIGAIADRRRQGARVVGNAKHWVILSIPAWMV